MESEVMYIKLDDIIPNRFQPREVFDDDALNKLAESIKQHGVIEPILVRPVSNKYEIIAGERRYKASVLAGLTKIPAMVREMDDKESSIIAFIENEHRSGVSAIEEARIMDRILKTNNMTQEELGKELGVNQSTIANKLRLLNLPLEVQEALMHNEISERHARSLLSIKDEEKQLELLKNIKEKRMTVRELDSEIKNMNENMNNYLNNQNTGTNESMGVDYTNYLNNNPVQQPVQEAPVQNEPGFMDFLNNYDNNNPVGQPVQEAPVQNEPGFMDFLNNYDNNNPVQQPVQEAPVQNEPGFMDFLNNYDNNNPVQQPVQEAPVQNEPGFMDFLNNYDNNNPVGQPVQEAPVQNEPGFMDFLNNYDNNNPVQQPVQEAPVQNEPGFMDFLNNYDNNNPVPQQAPMANLTPTEPMVEQLEETPPAFNENMYANESLDNVVINNVNPPITTDFSNQYVENNPNYMDISKANVIDSVDEIINRLKAVVDDIKSSSKYKVDTDEINFDDIYQITIKIDKRDF